VGQSFRGNGGQLETCKFYMFRSSSQVPDGNYYAKVYNHIWTYGSSAVPYGDPLAVSDAMVAADLPVAADKALITFTFSGANQIQLGATTTYCLTCEYTEVGSSLKCVYVCIDHIDPTHDGNACRHTVGYPWGYSADWDVPFYVYTDTPKTWDIISNNSFIPVPR
jgi:hypothetical protein